MRIHAEVLQPISWGLFVARLAPGAGFGVEMARVDDEVWLPRRTSVEAAFRVGLVKKFHLAVESTYRDYRKFSADTRILEIGAR